MAPRKKACQAVPTLGKWGGDGGHAPYHLLSSGETVLILKYVL